MGEMPPCVICDCEITTDEASCRWSPIFTDDAGHVGQSIDCHGVACPKRRVKILATGRLIVHSRLWDREELING